MITGGRRVAAMSDFGDRDRLLSASLPGLSGYPDNAHAAILLLFWGLIFEPKVFETRAVVDAVDHQGQPFHPRLPAGGLTGIEDDRANVVLGQSPFDLPHQLPALVPVRLP